MNNHYHIFSKYINPCRPSKHAEPTQSVGARLVASTIAAQAGEAERPRAGKRHWINPSTLEVIQYLQVTKPHHYFKCQNFQQVMSPGSPATDTTDVKKSVTLTGPNYAVWYLVTWARLLKNKLLQVIAHIAESARLPLQPMVLMTRLMTRPRRRRLLLHYARHHRPSAMSRKPRHIIS